MWCASGQTPQMRLVSVGISSTGRPTQKLLEAAQLRDLEIAFGHIALVVEEDLDLAVAFEPGDGVDGEMGGHRRVLRRREGGLGCRGMDSRRRGVTSGV